MRFGAWLYPFSFWVRRDVPLSENFKLLLRNLPENPVIWNSMNLFTCTFTLRKYSLRIFVVADSYVHSQELFTEAIIITTYKMVSMSRLVSFSSFLTICDWLCRLVFLARECNISLRRLTQLVVFSDKPSSCSSIIVTSSFCRIDYDFSRRWWYLLVSLSWCTYLATRSSA